jgi:serine/threonine-protein kinase
MDNPSPRTTPPKPKPALEPTTLPEVGESNGTDTELNVGSASATHAGKVTLGDYELGEKIGAGAMSSVYRARQVSKNRPAAVKVLRRHLAADPLFLQRFLREADTMSRLKHPNIVRCYGVGKQQGYHYIAMELIEGSSVGDWLFKKGRLSVGDAVHIALACARALQHSHQNGVIHRDVKPDNLLLTRAGRIKLTDMGLARPILEEDVIAISDGHGAGTPMYVAPEQARDAREADSRSDLYSLGCTFYLMLTGEVPFKGDGPVEIVLAKVRGHFKLPSELVPGLPNGLDDVISLLLAPHPDDRYQSASDLIIDLEQLRLASPALTFLGGFAEPTGKKAEKRTQSDDDLTAVSLDADQRTEKRWFVEWRRASGEWERRRCTAKQILDHLQDEAFARTAQASLYRDNFRPLYELSEFHDAVVARLEGHSLSGPMATTPQELPPPPPSGRGRYLLACLLGMLGIAVALGFWLGQVLR